MLRTVLGVFVITWGLSTFFIYERFGIGTAVLCGIMIAFVGGHLVLEFVEAWEAVDRERAENQAQKAARQNAFKAALVSRLQTTNKVAADHVSAIPDHLRVAHSEMARAQSAMKERAFAPFWDHIERATRSLALFEQALTFLDEAADRYRADSAEYATKLEAPPETRFPALAAADLTMQAALGISSALADTVHAAQRDFEFAMIFEQRRTNQILVTGFTTLSDALDGLSDRVTSAISRLEDSLDDHAAHTVARSEASSKWERDVSEMLNNIQRNRTPKYPG